MKFGQGWRVLTWQATTNSRDLERKAAFSNGGLSRDCATSLYCWLCQLQILLHISTYLLLYTIYCCFFLWLWALASHGSHWTLVTSWMQVTSVNGLDHVQELDRSILSKILLSMHNMCCAFNSGLKLMHVQTILYIIYLYIVRWNLWVAHWCSADAWQEMTRCKSILDHYPWQSCHSNAVARPCFAASVTLCAHTTVLSHHLRKRTLTQYILHEIMNFIKNICMSKLSYAESCWRRAELTTPRSARHDQRCCWRRCRLPCQLLDRVGLSRQSPSSRAKSSDDGQLPWWHDLQDPAGVNRINFQICVVMCSYTMLYLRILQGNQTYKITIRSLVFARMLPIHLLFFWSKCVVAVQPELVTLSSSCLCDIMGPMVKIIKK